MGESLRGRGVGCCRKGATSQRKQRRQQQGPWDPRIFMARNIQGNWGNLCNTYLDMFCVVSEQEREPTHMTWPPCRTGKLQQEWWQPQGPCNPSKSTAQHLRNKHGKLNNTQQTSLATYLHDMTTMQNRKVAASVAAAARTIGPQKVHRTIHIKCASSSPRGQWTWGKENDCLTIAQKKRNKMFSKRFRYIQWKKHSKIYDRLKALQKIFKMKLCWLFCHYLLRNDITIKKR